MPLEIEALAVFSSGAVLKLALHFISKRMTGTIKAKELNLLRQTPVVARDRDGEPQTLPAGVT